MTFLPWVLMALAFQEEPLETLLEGLHSNDPEVRTKASGGIVAGWKRWSKEDLAKLEEASIDLDLEMSVRGTDALSLILIRLEAPAVVLEGRKVGLMDRRAALAFWQKRLDGR
jgi:hypothetical protein